MENCVSALNGVPIKDKTARKALENIKDTIIAQGTSGVWNWRKWESGVAECWMCVKELTKNDLEIPAAADSNGVFNITYRVPTPFLFARELYCGVFQPTVINTNVTDAYGTHIASNACMFSPWTTNENGEDVANQHIEVYFNLSATDKDNNGYVMIDDLTIENLSIAIHIIDRWK